MKSDYFKFRVELLGTFAIFGVFVYFALIPHPDNLHFVASAILCWGALYQVVLSPLTTTIIYSILKYFKKKVDLPLMKSIFFNDDFRESFEKYCKEEYSIENFSFQVDVIKYENIINKKARNEMATKIYEKYLTDDALLEINTSGTKRKKVFQKIEMNEVDSNLFGDILKDVHLNLSDTYSRWINTSEYQLIIQKSQFVVLFSPEIQTITN
jgi:hypothetical protein